MKTVKIHEETHKKVEKLRKKLDKDSITRVTKGKAIDDAVTEKLGEKND